MKITSPSILNYVFYLFVLMFFSQCQIQGTPPKQSSSFQLSELTIQDIARGYQDGSWTVKEITAAYLKQIQLIDKSGPQLNSILQINPDAMIIADSLDQVLLAGGEIGILHGIPVLLKDNINSKDQMPTTAGSRALRNSFVSDDSFVAHQLRSAGALILGKTNLSEWANFRGSNSSSGWSGLGGQTKNPYVLTRNPCGSSSGSAVAIAANLAAFAIGTETNGSIVCPSHANGIVGIKPTVGLISRHGIIPISSTQDTAGPMARTLTDAVIALGVMTGVDQRDKKTIPSQGKALKDYTPFLKAKGLQGKRIGYYTQPLKKNKEVDTLFFQSLNQLKQLGATLVEINQIIPKGVGQHSFNVMLYEYKAGLNAYFRTLGEHAPVKSLDELIAFNDKDSVELKYFQQEYLKMANAKGDLNSKDYLESLTQLTKGSREEGIDLVMDDNDLDAIVAPTGSPAWSTDWLNGDNFHLGSSSPAAWAGYPNITLPMGNIHGLPVGISIFGRAWDEGGLIEIAFNLEQVTKARIIPRFLPTDEAL